MSRTAVLTDEMWARIEPLLPPVKGPMGPPFGPHRPVVEGAIYRLRTGIPWRDLPVEFGAWQTVHRRHRTWSLDGSWDRILAALQAQADAEGDLDWRVSVDSTISRVHQHAATAKRSVSNPSSSAVQQAHRGLSRMARNPGCARMNPTTGRSAGPAAG